MTAPHLLGTVDRTAGAVRLEQTLPAPAAEVWSALTDPARLAAWLAPVASGRPGPGAAFVLQMNAQETATCTVTTWEPPHELAMTWNYTGEGPSELRLRLEDDGAGTRILLEHSRIPADPVQYGGGWHVHLDVLAAHLSGDDRYPDGCDDPRFLAAYDQVTPHYAAAAQG
jgi:uncharacterized protein YndB with AHSA1/START domain